MGRLTLLLLALVAAIAVAGVAVTANASHQGAGNGCTSSGTRVQGDLISPSFPLDAQVANRKVSFKTWWEIESVDPVGHDQLTVDLVDAATLEPVSTTPVARLNPTTFTGGRSDLPFSSAGFNAAPLWSPESFDLPAEVTGSFRLRFRFDSGDNIFQGFRGWTIDDVQVTGAISVDPVSPLPLEDFEASGTFPVGWSAPGDGPLWRIQENPQQIAVTNPDIDPTLVTLPDSPAHLLADDDIEHIRVAWFGEPRSGTFCVGFDVHPPTISLDPVSATRIVGETHSMTATTSGATSTSVVRWSVSGANSASGVTPLGAGGTAAFSYTGAAAGSDFVTAHLDLDNNEIVDGNDTFGFANVEWAAAGGAQQQPAEETPAQQPAQQQPTQQQPRRDPFPADVETAPTLDQLSNATRFEEINIAAEEGPIFVRLPGGRGGAARASQAGTPRGFIPLTQAAQVPVGSIVEASRGRISLESTLDARGLRTQRAQFFDGMFQMRQPRARRPVTEIVLKGGSFRGCSRAGKSSTPRADASQRRRQGRRVRRVWGNGRGNFRTRGRYSSATVRGTTWLTEDRCGGTLTRVARRPRTNRVLVQDFVTRRSRLLRAGQSYFAARPLGRR